MRALTRMRTLAAACALLLFVSGTAVAGPGNRFIDRSGLPEPPPMVGDPDQPPNMPVLVAGRVYLIQLPPLLDELWRSMLRSHSTAQTRSVVSVRTHHAR